MAAAVERFGGLAILVNAAIAPFKVQPLEDCPVDDLLDMLHSGRVGVRAITRVAAHEWGKHGITANAICPYANSPSWAKWSEDNPGMADVAVGSTSVGRIGDCELDVGAAARATPPRSTTTSVVATASCWPCWPATCPATSTSGRS